MTLQYRLLCGISGWDTCSHIISRSRSLFHTSDAIDAYARASELDPSNRVPTAYTMLVASAVVCLPGLTGPPPLLQSTLTCLPIFRLQSSGLHLVHSEVDPARIPLHPCLPRSRLHHAVLLIIALLLTPIAVCSCPVCRSRSDSPSSLLALFSIASRRFTSHCSVHVAPIL